MKENFSQIDVVFGVNVVNAVERRYRAYEAWSPCYSAMKTQFGNIDSTIVNNGKIYTKKKKERKKEREKEREKERKKRRKKEKNGNGQQETGGGEEKEFQRSDLTQTWIGEQNKQ